MRILAIDTSSGAGSVAVVEDGQLKAEHYLHHKLTHSQTIMPMVDAVLKSCELKPSDIDFFAASVGPGSFTGLRIGVATVKGLAHAAGKKVIAVNTLEAIAYGLPQCEQLIVPIMDARRNQVYTASYIWDGGFRIVEPPAAMSVEECVEGCGNLLDVMFAGDGVPVYRSYISEKLGERAFFAPPFALMQRAAVVAALAAQKTDTAQEPHSLVPFYLRKSQAERELEEKNGAEQV